MKLLSEQKNGKSKIHKVDLDFHDQTTDPILVQGLDEFELVDVE